MSRYGEENYSPTPTMRQKDLVLSTNEFVFIQSKTNGQIRTYTGPIMQSISAQESLVIFNPVTKRFEETSDFEKARQIFTSAPENWYVVLKNPSQDNCHPDAAKAVASPDLLIGKKINIPGPCSFSLYPGQMAKVVQGHRLRSNQYLLARVYDADAAEKSSATILDADGKEVKSKEKYFAGQLLVIKGTEVSFYIPPTGIEVIPVNGRGDIYVRDAITLERLEYAILKDEDGEKRYIHGPAVVFPKPTETFVETPKGGNIFRALELSPISGIYVKVIAEYTEDKVTHKTGEELFITGNDQMIYYPRPEHALIQYDGKYMHHAIAIPEGEGRYILNRLTGEIKTVKGPAMYLPDPRKEVVVKRKLTPKECELLYPGNSEVLAYNLELSEKHTEKLARMGKAATTDVINSAYSTSNQLDSLAIFEANANISRGVSYTKPRTITLDTKYDGAVSVDVWTGYAVNVISKQGNRKVIVGPKTIMLDYDETIEPMELSTGKPKTTDKLLRTGFLRVENNKISDSVIAQTQDYVDVQISMSYCVDFLEEYKDNWFKVENYVKYLTDRMRSLIKREVKKYTINDFYANSTDIIRNTVLNLDSEKDSELNGRLFKENGMFVKDVEVLNVMVEKNVADLLETHQAETVARSLDLAAAQGRAATVKKLAEYEKEEARLKNENKLYAIEMARQVQKAKYEAEEADAKARRAAAAAEKQAKADMQKVLDAIAEAELKREQATADEQLRVQNEEAKIRQAEQEAYAATIEKIMASVSPDLVAALSTKANADLLSEATRNMSPYAIAKGESVSDTINTLLRGTTLENVIDKVTK